jgi:hypothetical protein
VCVSFWGTYCSDNGRVDYLFCNWTSVAVHPPTHPSISVSDVAIMQPSTGELICGWTKRHEDLTNTPPTIFGHWTRASKLEPIWVPQLIILTGLRDFASNFYWFINPLAYYIIFSAQNVSAKLIRKFQSRDQNFVKSFAQVAVRSKELSSRMNIGRLLLRS